MAFDSTKVLGFTEANLGAEGYAPASYSAYYDGNSSDWVSSDAITTYLKGRGVAVGDFLVLTCKAGKLSSIGIIAESAGKYVYKIATLADLT